MVSAFLLIFKRMAYEYHAKVLRVIDGDTIELEIDLGFGVFKKEKVRLARVDTPEVYGVKKESAEYQIGKLASEYTEHWLSVANYRVTVKTEKTGKYGRYIAEVNSSDGRNLSDDLLENGHATLYSG